MVLTQRHSHAHALQDAIARIQPSRIFGIAGAITINTAALMLLLVPVTPPMSITQAENKIEVLFIEPAKPKPPEPLPVPVVRPTPQQVRTVQPVRQDPLPRTQPDEAPPLDIGSEIDTQVDTPQLDNIGPVGPPNVPQPSTRLEYASAPPPTYPPEALARELEGTVVLKVLVDVDGSPLSVEIERSSGHRKLDDAARRQVLRKWKFKPAIKDGQVIQVYGVVPVSFSLDRQ